MECSLTLDKNRFTFIDMSKLLFRALIICVFFASSTLQAVEVSIAKNSLNAKALNPYMDIFIANRSTKPIAVGNTLVEQILDKNGKEISIQVSEDEIFIFPEQTVLMPGERITVTVRWISKNKITNERAFFFKAKEMPYVTHDTDEQKKNLTKDKVRFNTIITVTTAKRIYVTSGTHKPKMKVNYIKHASSNENENRDFIKISATNHGKGHYKPTYAYIKYKEKGKLTWKYKRVRVRNTWLPKQKESVFIRWPEKMAVKGTKLEFLRFSMK